MLDLNDLRVFERVASLRSFSAAARALGIPKSSASRSMQRLEAELGTRLFQRTTREVVPTESGEALLRRCTVLLSGIGDAVESIASLTRGPRGTLRITAGIGAGPNILADLLPVFVRRYPEVRVFVDLSSRHEDLVRDAFDVAIRFGPMPESGLVAARLGEMRGYLCASPDYLARRGAPRTLQELADHDLIGMPSVDGRPRHWLFTRNGETVRVEQHARILVNCAVTIHRLVLNGAGIGNIAAYMSGPGFAAGTLVQLFPEWTTPTIEVHAVFPSTREMSPAVRAFVDFMKESSRVGHAWQFDPVANPISPPVAEPLPSPGV